MKFFNLALALLLGQGYVVGQTSVNTHRLIAESTEYNFATIGWWTLDSSSYTYETFEDTLRNVIPLERFNGLEGLIPVSPMNSALFFSGLYPQPASPIIDYFSPLEFSQAKTFFQPTADTGWTDILNIQRSFFQSNLASETITTGSGDDTNYTTTQILFDNAGAPNEIIITSNYGIEDTIDKFTCSYQDGKFTAYTNHTRYITGEWIKQIEVSTHYQPDGKPKEEVTRYYAYTLPELSYVTYKWSFIYNEEHQLVDAYQSIPDNGSYVDFVKLHFEYSGNQLIEASTWARTVDTSTIPTLIGDWDTLNLQQYFFSDGWPDSVVSYRNFYDIGDPLQFNFKESFTYNQDKLTDYQFTDNQFSFSPQHINAHWIYDEKGRIDKAEVLYSTPGIYPLYRQADTLYNYDKYDNIITKKIITGISYESPEEIALDTMLRKNYYYTHQVIAGTGSESLFIQAYPSPASNLIQLFIGFDYDQEESIQLEIWDMQSKLVASYTINTYGNSNFTIDCSQWQSGLYNIWVKSGNRFASQKIIVTHN